MLKLEFAYGWGAARTTFYRKQGQDEDVAGGVKELLAFIESNPGQTAETIGEAFGKPLRAIERGLKALREQGEIEFEGAPRTRGYFVKDN